MPPANKTAIKTKGKANANQAPVAVDPLNEPLSDELMDGLLASQASARSDELSAIKPVMSPQKKRSMEWLLQNPEKSSKHNKTKKGRNEKFPRQGLAKRQASVMKTASKADPFMRDLDAKGHLGSSHMERPLDRSRGDNFLKRGQKVGRDGTLRGASNAKIHTIGMGEFGNREGVLPQMTGPKSRSTQGHQARQGKWSEADVNPVTIDYHDRRDDYVEPKNRGAERLLHTSKNSNVKKANGKGGMSPGKADFSQYITNDHYHSMIPVSAVQQNYKANNAYTPKYMDPEGNKSSLDLHDEQEAVRLAEEAKANAPVEEPVVEAPSASAPEVVAEAAPEVVAEAAPEVVAEAPAVEEPKLTRKERAALRKEEEAAEQMRRAKQSADARAGNKKGGRGRKGGKKKKKSGKKRKN